MYINVAKTDETSIIQKIGVDRILVYRNMCIEDLKQIKKKGGD